LQGLASSHLQVPDFKAGKQASQLAPEYLHASLFFGLQGSAGSSQFED
jgi:hypothetical protein